MCENWRGAKGSGGPSPEAEAYWLTNA